MAENERSHILKMLESGQITSEEAVTLIRALDTGDTDSLPPNKAPVQDVASHTTTPHDQSYVQTPTEPAVTEEQIAYPQEVFTPEPEDLPDVSTTSPAPARPGRIRKFWLVPLWVGAAITVLGGLLMLLAWQGSGFGFWFACAWLPFTIGVLTLLFAWLIRGTPWLYLQVRQPEGNRPHNIVIGFPLPLRLAGWLLRTFRHRIPGLENTNVDEIIIALENISPETPFVVEVDEGDGKHVEIYIG